jgi:hypothetical protein
MMLTEPRRSNITQKTILLRKVKKSFTNSPKHTMNLSIRNVMLKMERIEKVFLRNSITKWKTSTTQTLANKKLARLKRVKSRR